MAEEHTWGWVVSCWHAVGWNVSLHFVVNRDGKPRADWNPCAAPLDAYRWRTYHAAAKWLREHAEELGPGYTVRNLDEIMNDCRQRWAFEKAGTR